ncbi:hypothetical protein PVAND_002379 [Polypedilum vanderplanki]|uniref:C2H2-type domain-containing protein n=1 Tax=Polypedilum vanderplanki TaxID=319348 RepID=A0A9J6BRG2_POLVA|nr:hypothetical protein PVAND_002379 [Polypedilum vanderplanki]
MELEVDNLESEKLIDNSEELTKPIENPQNLIKLKKTKQKRKSSKRLDKKKKFKCFHCENTYHDPKARKLHIQINHMMQKYDCVKLDCDFIAKRKHLLIKHLKNFHLELSDEERNELLEKGHRAEPQYMYEMKQDDSD